MGRRHEEKVDEEELARLENPEGSPGKIRVKLPNDGKKRGTWLQGRNVCPC